MQVHRFGTCLPPGISQYDCNFCNIINSDQTNRYSFIFFIWSATQREYSCNELIGCSFLFSSCLYLPLDSLWHIFYKYFVTSFTILFGKYFLQYDTKLIWLNSNLRFCNVCTQNWSITSFSPYAVGEKKKRFYISTATIAC